MEQTTAGNPKDSTPLFERVFGLAEAGTNPRTEFVAGLTTFLTMVYIVFVDPRFSVIPEWTRARYLSPLALPRRYRRW